MGQLSAGTEPRIRWARTGIVLALSLAASLVLYARSIDNGFRDDDFVFLKHVATTSPPGCIFRPSEDFAFYRPGAIALFLFERRLFGLNGGLYIFFNYLMHLSIAGLLIRLLLLVGFETSVAFLAGSLFLVGAGHYGKQVMWASSGAGIFAVLLSMVAMILVLRWADRTANPMPGGSSRRWGLAACACAALFAAPFFHESSLVVAPISICILVMFGRRSLRSKWIWAAVVVFAALLPATVFLFLRSQYPAYRLSLEVIPRTASALVRYLGFMAVPLQPSATANRAPVALSFLARHNAPIHYAVGAVMLLAAAAWVISPLPRKRFVGIWLLLALLPFTLVAMPENRLELRYVYGASLPFSAMAAAAVIAAIRSTRKHVALAGWFLLMYLCVVSVALVVTLEGKYDAAARNQRNAERMEEIRNLDRSPP